MRKEKPTMRSQVGEEILYERCSVRKMLLDVPYFWIYEFNFSKAI